ncbi:MAG: hypothetical protein JWQ33_514, partial [Ramlibacter sp.]|nr:hypothetical protein [Ramlibacter sp.]
LNAVHMVPATGSPEVDWDSYWGSLTFDLPRRERAPGRTMEAPSSSAAERPNGRAASLGAPSGTPAPDWFAC